MTAATHLEHQRRITVAQRNGARNKAIRLLVERLVAEYLQGRSAEACMRDLVAE